MITPFMEIDQLPIPTLKSFKKLLTMEISVSSLKLTGVKVFKEKEMHFMALESLRKQLRHMKLVLKLSLTMLK